MKEQLVVTHPYVLNWSSFKHVMFSWKYKEKSHYLPENRKLIIPEKLWENEPDTKDRTEMVLKLSEWTHCSWHQGDDMGENEQWAAATRQTCLLWGDTKGEKEVFV
jgi:hypothetical protein